MQCPKSFTTITRTSASAFFWRFRLSLQQPRSELTRTLHHDFHFSILALNRRGLYNNELKFLPTIIDRKASQQQRIEVLISSQSKSPSQPEQVWYIWELLLSSDGSPLCESRSFHQKNSSTFVLQQRFHFKEFSLLCLGPMISCIPSLLWFTSSRRFWRELHNSEGSIPWAFYCSRFQSTTRRTWTPQHQSPFTQHSSRANSHPELHSAALKDSHHINYEKSLPVTSLKQHTIQRELPIDSWSSQLLNNSVISGEFTLLFHISLSPHTVYEVNFPTKSLHNNNIPSLAQQVQKRSACSI